MSAPEAIACAAVAVIALGALAVFARRAGRVRWVLSIAVAYLVGIGAVAWRPAEDPASAPGVPAVTAAGGHVGSGACKSCHPGEYASWHRSFHRSMTQVARPSAVVPVISRLHLEEGGRVADLERRGDAYFARLPDPDIEAALSRRGVDPRRGGAPVVERRVVMTTGSHHYQAYWLESRRKGELRELPFVYLIGPARWIPRDDAFLHPPDAPPYLVRWNSSCIQCHAVAGRPGLDARTDEFRTQVAELGIACEACHGPGGEHVAEFRNPAKRFLAQIEPGRETRITNPARLDQERASEVCGQCHSYALPRDERQWWSSGYAETYRAGQELAASRKLLEPGPAPKTDAPLGDSLEGVFWPDGDVRVAGREYNALVRSRCFSRGSGDRKLGCLSCHSMHESDPDDQLAAHKQGNEACLGCHEALRAGVERHTHHAAGSSGSLCYSCHMPRTSYALLGAIRSHRIASPTPVSVADSRQPNACNLCHLDRTLHWTIAALARWQGHESAQRSAEGVPVAASLDWLLSGDAAVRAIVADAMGSVEAQRASGMRWEAPFLELLSADPYAAVRFIAARSLAALPHEAPAPGARAELLLDDTGRPRPDEIARRVAARDDRPVTLSE